VSFQEASGIIRWKTHFASAPERVFEALATDEGRSTYWAESAIERDGIIEFRIHNYAPFTGRVLARQAPHLFALEYFGTRVTFTLAADGQGGTDLSLLAEEVDESIRTEMIAGVSVLMAMKAAVDHGVDLRNHDPRRSWVDGYADN
jgi:uncharacterized protein YndB with AHSA1/START domain